MDRQRMRNPFRRFSTPRIAKECGRSAHFIHSKCSIIDEASTNGCSPTWITERVNEGEATYPVPVDSCSPPATESTTGPSMTPGLRRGV
ncbi:hypothetical protein J6590_073127 [Homalodisca vitripennis]|nr:hypothetical protein J6590_073127 [Homalodisca vitripennis]